MAVQGHPRSSIVMLIESAYATSYYSSIVGLTMDVFEILTHKARKWLVSPHHPCLTPPLRGTRQNFEMTFTPQKLDAS